uniref:Uncharacterized protein n=1 Tax=Sinocyclocheilus anshuiensis TaxID=1608454 RepID=A0A671LI16_9TELE
MWESNHKKKSFLPKDAEANFAVAVEVGVETNSVVPGSDQFDTWRVNGIVGRTAEQEEEEAALIWCVEGASDKGVNLWRHEKEDGAGIGTVFGSLIIGYARNPSLKQQLFSYNILTFIISYDAISIFPFSLECYKLLVHKENL